jgi:hypothetical protein
MKSGRLLLIVLALIGGLAAAPAQDEQLLLPTDSLTILDWTEMMNWEDICSSLHLEPETIAKKVAVLVMYHKCYSIPLEPDIVSSELVNHFRPKADCSEEAMDRRKDTCNVLARVYKNGSSLVKYCRRCTELAEERCEEIHSKQHRRFLGCFAL